MPLHRLFPTDHRTKMTFEGVERPLYIHIDDLGGWNVDTRYITNELREWIERSFEVLFNQQFPQLTVAHILNAYDEFYGMFLLHVTITKDVKCPEIVLKYYDKELRYQLPGRLLRGHSTTCDAILDDLM